MIHVGFCLFDRIYPFCRKEAQCSSIFIALCVRFLRRALSQSSAYWRPAPLKSTNATGVHGTTQHLHLISHKKGGKGRRGNVAGMKVGRHRPRPVRSARKLQSLICVRIISTCLLHDTIYLIQKNWHYVRIDASLWGNLEQIGMILWASHARLQSLATVIV